MIGHFLLCVLNRCMLRGVFLYIVFLCLHAIGRAFSRNAALSFQIFRFGFYSHFLLRALFYLLDCFFIFWRGRSAFSVIFSRFRMILKQLGRDIFSIDRVFGSRSFRYLTPSDFCLAIMCFDAVLDKCLSFIIGRIGGRVGGTFYIAGSVIFGTFVLLLGFFRKLFFHRLLDKVVFHCRFHIFYGACYSFLAFYRHFRRIFNGFGRSGRLCFNVFFFQAISPPKSRLKTL